MQDAVTVAPDVYKVVLENEQVRGLEVRMAPGAKTERHGHPALVAVMPGRNGLCAATPSRLRSHGKRGDDVLLARMAGVAAVLGMFGDPLVHGDCKLPTGLQIAIDLS